MADGIQGLLGNIGNLFSGGDPQALYGGDLSDPATKRALATRGLLAMAGSFADSAMPTRMPTPFGAVLGHAAAAMGTGEDAAMAARLQNAQSAQQLALAHLTQAKGGLISQIPGAQSQLDAELAGAGSPTAPMIPGAAVTPGTTGTASYGGGKGAMFTPEQIADAALKNNLDPELVNATVAIESNHGANVSNTKSPSYTGLFQMAPANAPGGANDKPENQLQLGLTQLAKERSDLEARLGRPAANWEVYLAHQQGPGGAAALLNNPNTPAGQVIFNATGGKEGGRNISNNLGNPDAPASAFLDTWKNKYQHFAGPYAGQATRPAQLAASAGPPPAGLLGPSPGAPAAAADVAAATAAQPGQPIGSADLNRAEAARVTAPPGGQLAQAGPPPSLVPAPPPGPAVPPPAQPQPPAGVPQISGAPSPRAIALAQQTERMYIAAGLTPPAYVTEISKFAISGAQAARDAQIKLQSTPFRPSGVLLRGYDANGQPIWMQAPGTPQIIGAPPTAQGQPQSQIAFPGTNRPPQPLGVTGPSEAQKSFGAAAGANQANLGPLGAAAPPGEAPPVAPGQAVPAPSPDQPQASPFGELPPLSEQKLPESAEEYKSQIPKWTDKINDWTTRAGAAHQAEARMETLASAFKSIQTGAWVAEKADLATKLAAVGIHLDPATINDPAAVQTVLHENILSTLPLLKEATSKPTQTEFAVTREAREGPNIQPAANLTMLSEDMALLRQAQNLPSAYYMSGWKNPVQFETAYLNRNKLAPLAESIKTQIGPFPGMPGFVPPPGSSMLPAPPSASQPGGAALPPRGPQPPPGVSREDIEREIQRRRGG